MSGQNTGSAGEILASSTAIAAGVTVLPETGTNTIGSLLAMFSIACGAVVLTSLLVRMYITRKDQ